MGGVESRGVTGWMTHSCKSSARKQTSATRVSRSVRGENTVASLRDRRRYEVKDGATVDLHRAGTNGRLGRRPPATTLTELAEMVRKLRQSLEDYAPAWYTKTMDDRIREMLAAADCSRTAFHE